MGSDGLKALDSQYPGRGAPCSAAPLPSSGEKLPSLPLAHLHTGVSQALLAGAGKGSPLTDRFRTSPALSPPEPCGLSKAPSWDLEPAGAKVSTLSPASHGNSPIGRRTHLARAAAGDSRAAPTLLSQDPPQLPHREALPPPCALTWRPRPGPDSYSRRAPLDSCCFRVCAERRGGAPVRAAPSAPASRPSDSPRLLAHSSTASPQPLGKAHVAH